MARPAIPKDCAQVAQTLVSSHRSPHPASHLASWLVCRRSPGSADTEDHYRTAPCTLLDPPSATESGSRNGQIVGRHIDQGKWTRLRPWNFWHNDERVHHYQRGRASITGLGLWSGKIIETEQLVVVVTARLVLSSFHGRTAFAQDPKPTSAHPMTSPIMNPFGIGSRPNPNAQIGRLISGAAEGVGFRRITALVNIQRWTARTPIPMKAIMPPNIQRPVMSQSIGLI